MRMWRELVDPAGLNPVDPHDVAVSSNLTIRTINTLLHTVEAAMMKKTVLIVDDETIHIEVLFNLVQDFSTVIFARSMEDARQLLDQRLPDLILLDNQIKDGFGTAFCREIKRNTRTRHIPVLMITASDDEDTLHLAMEAGALALITKPVNGPILRQRIINLLTDIENNCLRYALPEITESQSSQ